MGYNLPKCKYLQTIVSSSEIISSLKVLFKQWDGSLSQGNMNSNSLICGFWNREKD